MKSKMKPTRLFCAFSMACACLFPLLADDSPTPVPAHEAAKRFTLPSGFSATLFVGEPDVVQPIAFTFDDRGRMWVVECNTYPNWDTSVRKDRVLIFEDADGDGKFDKKTVFWDQGKNLTGIAYGFGGIWLCATPNMIFIPDANHDDIPDGPPMVKLDGWDIAAKHNVFNSLIWGPDGWLYGCNGILSNSKIGKPGSPATQRTAMNCGVWRYHPSRQIFEAVAHGTTNPWGLDFDDYGQMFITNCVIEHLFHVVPGGHYKRMFGQDIMPHSYQLMTTCADHLHWTGSNWTEARGGEAHDAAGGGHAHSGAMVYLGDQFPAEYRNRIFMCNIHGNRINQDILKRNGSGYIASHAPDFLRANDPWFRGIAVHQGPEGSVYVSDWSDTGECHNYEVADRSNGRIYRISYGTPTPFRGDLAKLSDDKLVDLLASKNDWLVRHALRLLQERVAAGKARPKLDLRIYSRIQADVKPSVSTRLRYLWALEAVNGSKSKEIHSDWLLDEDDSVRAAAIRLAVEKNGLREFNFNTWQKPLITRRSAAVRLELASALQKLKPEEGQALALLLVSQGQDADDPNIPLLLWYGIEPIVANDKTAADAFAKASRIPHIRKCLARRIASPTGATTRIPPENKLAGVNQVLAWIPTADSAAQSDFIVGLQEALIGQRNIGVPSNWSAVQRQLSSGDKKNYEGAMRLALIFGDTNVIEHFRVNADDRKLPADTRGEAILALTQARVDVSPTQWVKWLDDEPIRVAVLQSLSAYSLEQTPLWIMDRYPTFDSTAKQQAISTLASRTSYAHRLLDAVEKGTIPRSDLTAYHAQQLQFLKDKAVAVRVTKIYGSVRATAADRVSLIAETKAKLPTAVLQKADVSNGRAIFAKQCASCHMLFDAGGKIGPDITGAQRTNLDYLLSNVLDPSAVVANDYRVTLIETKDGRILNGIVKQENAAAVTLQTATEAVVLLQSEIESREVKPISLMPDGLLNGMSDEEVRDLVGYLASPKQVRLK